MERKLLFLLLAVVATTGAVLAGVYSWEPRDNKESEEAFATWVLVPAVDTHISQGKPYASPHDWSYLVVRSEPMNHSFALLKFEVDVRVGEVARAELVLNVASENVEGEVVAIACIENDGWDGAVNWKAIPVTLFPPTPNIEIRGTVTKIIDGDTLWVDNYKVRLLHVDDRGGSSLARNFLEDIIPPGTEVFIDVNQRSPYSYDRIVGTVYKREDGKYINVNRQLIEAGVVDRYPFVPCEFMGGIVWDAENRVLHGSLVVDVTQPLRSQLEKGDRTVSFMVWLRQFGASPQKTVVFYSSESESPPVLSITERVQ